MFRYLVKNYIFIFLFLSASFSQAQITFNDSAIVEEVKPVDLIDITSNIELATKKLKNINKRTEVHSSVRAIDSLLPLHAEMLERKAKSYQNFKRSHPNKQKVINLINKWGSFNAYLDTWQKELSGFLDKNTVWLEQLGRENKTWTLTLESIENVDVPDEVVANIRQTQKSIESIINKLTDQNKYLLELETDILIQKESVIEVLDDLELWKQSKEFSLGYKRHVAIWNMSQEEGYSSNEDYDTLASFKGSIRGVKEYLNSPENNIPVFFLVILAMWLWLWYIKRSFKSMNLNSKDESLMISKNIIVNKLPYALVFTTTIITIVYFSHTPNLLSEFLLLVALISAIPLINSIIHERFKWLHFVIIVLYLMNTVKSYVWYSSSFYRVYLFIEAAIALTLLVIMVHPFSKTKRMDLRPLARVLVLSMPLVVLLVFGAMGSNILGYTNLTDLLLKITIQGSVLMVVLYGILISINGLLTGTIHYYFTKLEQYDFKYKFYLEKKAGQVVTIFGYVFVTVYLLHIIDAYDEIVQWVIDELNEPIQAGTITFTWGSILSFISVLVISYVITSFISKIVDGGVLNFMRLPKGIPAIISVIVRYFLIAFAFVLAISYLGIDLSKFNLMAGALGLGIGFGLQNIISNFISGLILIFERPIQTNDVVEVGTLMGEVKKIGIRSSNVRTFNGAEVVVPNSNLISNEVINWTLSDNVKRIEINIGAAYGTDLQQVVDILKEVAEADPRILKEPAPRALFDKFGDSSLDFRLLYWVPVDDGIQSKSDISIAVYNRFKEDGITIPFPQRDINLRKEDIDQLNGIESGQPNEDDSSEEKTS